MPSPPVTASSPLITGASVGYQSIAMPEEEIEEIRPVPIPDNQAEGMGQNRRGRQFIFDNSAYNVYRAERFTELRSEVMLHRTNLRDIAKIAKTCEKHAESLKHIAHLFSLSALIALVAMKTKGYLEEHSGYFWFLLVTMVVPYVLTVSRAHLIDQQAELIRDIAQELHV